MWMPDVILRSFQRRLGSIVSTLVALVGVCMEASWDILDSVEIPSASADDRAPIGRHHPAHQKLRAFRRKVKQQTGKTDAQQEGRGIQVHVHNLLHAVRQDELLPSEGYARPKVSGKAGWRKWLPDACLRCAFKPMHLTDKAIAENFGKQTSPAQVSWTRKMVVERLWHHQSQRFNAWLVEDVGFVDALVVSIMWDEMLMYLMVDDCAPAYIPVQISFASSSKLAQDSSWERELIAHHQTLRFARQVLFSE
eukprot:6492156-Amphidinium_carterae.1